MVSEEELMRLFCDNTPPILELSEIKQWCSEKQLDCSHLEEQLQGLVDKNCIGCRKISTGENSTQILSVYWLKKVLEKPAVTPASGIKSSVEQGSLLRRGLKRTRPKFISPLLSQKKQKLGAVETEDQQSSTHKSSESLSVIHAAPVRARLDITQTQGQDSQLVDREMVEVTEREELSVKSSMSRGKSESEDREGVELLAEEKRTLEVKLKEKEETLRKLKLVKMYRTKNDLKELGQLITKWRGVAQEAAESLLGSSTHEPRPTMAQMLDYMHIDHELIQYSAQDEAFY